MEIIKKYISLTKPGVLAGNLITTIAGFLLASQGLINWTTFIFLIAGTSLVIGSACVINNYFDQDIDKLMTRTKSRAIVSGAVPANNALEFGIILGIIGISILYLFTNILVFYIGILGFIVYVFLYGRLAKRKSIHGTLVGSISGAMPILAGYVGASNTINLGAVIVFMIIFFWQFPEFYSISIFRLKEYKNAGIPVMPVIKGISNTKKQIILYTYLYVISTLLLSLMGYTGFTYLIIMTLLGVHWLLSGFEGVKTKDNPSWAKYMFKLSLINLLVFCFMISIDSLLP